MGRRGPRREGGGGTEGRRDGETEGRRKGESPPIVRTVGGGAVSGGLLA
jgi:hypothetical protein